MSLELQMKMPSTGLRTALCFLFVTWLILSGVAIAREPTTRPTTLPADGADLSFGHGEALMDACISGEFETALSLIRRGADVNYAEPRHHSTPLHFAVSSFYGDLGLPLVKALLSKGADVHARGIGGDSPLHSACESGTPALAKCLLDHGADPDARNDLGETPIEVAALTINSYEESHDSAGIIALLLSRGADVNARDKRGRTALDFARSASIANASGPRDQKARREELVGLLMRHNAKTGADLPDAPACQPSSESASPNHN